MRLSTHPLRFAYGLFLIYALIARTHYYPHWIITVVFALWITYELVWAYLLDNNNLVMALAIVLGILASYAVYNFAPIYIPIIAVYIVFGIILNIASARAFTILKKRKR